MASGRINRVVVVTSLLSELDINEEASIHGLQQHILTPRLTEMGFIPGKRVKLLYKAPFGGPLAIDMDGFTISLRKSEAALVMIQKLGN